MDGGCPRNTTVCTGDFVPVEASTPVDGAGTTDSASVGIGGSPTAIGETPLFTGSGETSSPIVMPAATATAPKKEIATGQSDAGPIRRGAGKNAASIIPKPLFLAVSPTVSGD